MKIEFAVTGEQAQQHVIDRTHELFAKAASNVGVPIEDLSLIIIADDAHYAQAVERIHPGGGFTEHKSGMRGMGKTHTERDAAGRLSSSIVIHLNAWGRALTSVLGEHVSFTADRNELGEQLCLYLIYHELGHCRDNTIRPDRPEHAIFVPGRGFEISQFARYYADILLEEYAATTFSAPWMTKAVYESELQGLRETLDLLRSESDDVKEQYYSDSASLTKVASTIAGWCWFQLIQFAKTAAARRVNSELSSAALGVWPEADDQEAMERLTEFEAELTRHWAKYPAWGHEPPPFMREMWESFAILEGFRFVEDEQEGSGVFW